MTTVTDGGPAHRPRDLDDRTEIAEMVRRFYADVAQDELLCPIFNGVARVDWGVHVPKLVDYWCRTLLAEPGYVGNPYTAHREVHARQAFTAEHFVRWLDLFHETIDLGWSGPYAERAKAFARKVAAIHSKQLIGVPVVYTSGELDPADPALSTAAPSAPLPVGVGHARRRDPEPPCDGASESIGARPGPHPLRRDPEPPCDAQGGDPPCWAHLFDETEYDPPPPTRP